MIEGIIGRPGAGKSYELTRRALDAADRDRLVFANYGISHPNIFMFAPEQLMDLPPGLVIIDEAHLWFPARMSLKLPMSWLAGMSQTRKKGWDMIWAAQHESRVDRVVRDVSSYLWASSAWFESNGHPVLFSAASYEPERFRQAGHRLTREWHFFSQKVADAYNTHESLSQATHTQQDNDAYAARKGKSVLEGKL